MTMSSPHQSISESREGQAHALCLRLLTAKARTRAELSGQLAKRGYPDDIRDRVLDRLTVAGLVDDADFAQEWVEAADARDLDKVFLVAPSSTDERIAMTTSQCRGFVYATAVMGVTGARAKTSDLAAPLVARTRKTTDLPIGVGLGVSNGAQAAEMAAYADGVIVGSAFVRTLLDNRSDEQAALKALASLTEDLAAGVRAR